jgi:hypothetical protein
MVILSRLLAALTALATLTLCARPVVAQPAAVSRVLKTFDFEERRAGNVEELPMNWVKVEGSGLPHYVNGKLSPDARRSGEFSFRFDLNGGSLIYRYQAGRIKVVRGAHYRIETFVRTTPLRSAKARMSAYFADVDGRPIRSTITHSEPWALAPGDPVGPDDWHRLELRLTADEERADSLVIELGLLQPQFWATASLGDRSLFTQDIRGTAWFDDVQVAQVPRVGMTTDRPGNVFRRSDPLNVSVTVNDRFVDDLAGRLVVRDAAGNVAYQRSGSLDLSAAAETAPGQKSLTIALPDLPAGWYEVALQMTSNGQFVGDHSMALVRLADDNARVRPDPRFGVGATKLPVEGWAELPELLPLLGAGRVKLAVWNSQGDVDSAGREAFDRVLEGLAQRQIVPTACLVDVPPSVAQAIGGDTWGHLLRADPEKWRPTLAFMVARHAAKLDRWQFGDDAAAPQFVDSPDMVQTYRLLYREFQQLVMKPDLAMPWPAWYELGGDTPATVALSVPPDVLPAQLPLYMHDLRLSEGHNLSLSLQPLSRERYGRAVQIRDLAQRVCYALAGGATRIDLPLPFTVQRDGNQLVKQPQETLLVIRTLLTVLGGAQYKGKVPIAENVDAFLFDRNGQGILMLWSRGNDASLKPLAINLGAQPLKVDLFGNVTPLAVTGEQRDSADVNRTVQLEVGPTPFFLVDIDGPMAQIRSSVAFDNPLLESSFKAHTRRLRFVNPYKTAVSGTLKLTGPQGWTVTLPNSTFSLNPGEAYDGQVTLEFPYNSFAGTKTLTAEFRMSDGARFSVPVEVRLGLSDVGLQTLAIRDGNDVIVQQTITNYGDAPINYTAFTLYPGQARQERLVTNLAPGRSTVKKYRFTNVPATAAAAKLRSGVKELEGVRVLNEEVEVR